MNVWYRVVLGIVIVFAAVTFLRFLVGGSTVTLFTPAGPVAGAEGSLIITEVLLMLLVAVPMFIFLFTFAWKYRAGNKHHVEYNAEWHGGKSQLILWAIPVVLVAVLAVINWQSAHALDPYKPISSSATPMTIEVVALPWKWLFIYPEQGIATVNFVEFPAQVPVHFDLTADAPMSSFWIPQLGSQMYAMDAMVTQLNLMASTTGEFSGKDTEINGAGYAGMRFIAKSVSMNEFNNWMLGVRQSRSPLTPDVYNALAAPSQDNPPAYYSSVDQNLFSSIVLKYMMPSSSIYGAAATATPTGDVMQMIPATQHQTY